MIGLDNFRIAFLLYNEPCVHAVFGQAGGSQYGGGGKVILHRLVESRRLLDHQECADGVTIRVGVA